MGPPRRCPNCGGLVYVPCRLCRVRKTLAEKPASGAATQVGGDRRAAGVGSPTRASHAIRGSTYLAARKCRR